MGSWAKFIKKRVEEMHGKVIIEDMALKITKEVLQGILDDGWKDKQGILAHIISEIEEELKPKAPGPHLYPEVEEKLGK